MTLGLDGAETIAAAVLTVALVWDGDRPDDVPTPEHVSRQYQYAVNIVAHTEVR